ncbi:HNH endonuclease signature motif containing protein [Pseudactinotalea sp. Z1748]|uniref:HNH endonuclease signature motif containing protein n=1 Tax=Pseudactinotalea sp. Z1748 TaxID=3413027 RepID=UPI003C7E005E
MAVHPLPHISPTQEVHAALDGLSRLDPGGLSAAGQSQLLVDLKRIESRVRAYTLKVLNAAEKANTARKSGHADTASWAAKHTNDDGRDTSRQTKLATRLSQRGPTQRALDAGDISPDHAEIIVGAGEKLPNGLTITEAARVEEDLVAKAKQMPPSVLRQRARRQLEALKKDRESIDTHEEGQIADEEQQARAHTRLTIRDNHDGTVTGHFTLPVFHGHLLRKIIHTMTAPRRTNHGTTNGTGGPVGAGGGGAGGAGGGGSHDASGQGQALFGTDTTGPHRTDTGATGLGAQGSSTHGSGAQDLSGLPDPARVAQARRTDWANAHGLALAELIEHLPTDHLSPKTAATIIITLDEQVLRGRIAAAGLDTGEKISAAHARQLACNSGLVPLVLGGQSQPLDLGRGNRLFTETQRTALTVRHTTCAADGCARPYSWCELHHATPWENGGPTDLDNAVPLCHRHHRMAHDHKYHQRRTSTGTYTFTMRH